MTMTDDEKRIYQRETTGRSQTPNRNPSSASGQDAEDDPLAELIRIVKEDDPFGDLLNERAPAVPRPAAPAPRASSPLQRATPRAPAPPQPAEPVARAPAVRPPEPQAAPPRAEAPIRQEPPPLDPIDLDQALRDFRDAPEELLRGDVGWADEPLEPAAVEATHGAEVDDPYQDPAFDDADDAPYADYELEGDEVEAAIAAGQYGEEAEYSEPSGRRPRRGTFFAVGILMGLVGLGASAGYLYTQGARSSTGDGPLPIIRADSQPVKIAPDDPGGAKIPNQERLVYNRVSGETNEPESRLVSREEEILGPPKSAAKEETRFPAEADEVTTGTTGATGAPKASDGAAERGSLAPLAAPPPATSGVAPVPRAVKTVAVRPDGTIVTVEPKEPEAAKPVEKPAQAAAAVPTPPARPAPVRIASSEQGSTSAQPQRVQPVQPVQPASNAPLALNSRAQQQQRAQPPSTSQQVARAAPQQPTRGQQRPSWFTPDSPAPQQPARATPAPQQPARATPAPQQPAPAPSAAPSAGNGQFVVQLAARKSEEQANQAYTTLKGRYASLLGRYQPLIQRADLGERGVYYRVRVGPMASADAARGVCEQLKAAGLPDCLVRPR